VSYRSEEQPKSDEKMRFSFPVKTEMALSDKRKMSTNLDQNLEDIHTPERQNETAVAQKASSNRLPEAVMELAAASPIEQRENLDHFHEEIQTSSPMKKLPVQKHQSERNGKRRAHLDYILSLAETEKDDPSDENTDDE
jgi:hypothetical protein